MARKPWKNIKSKLFSKKTPLSGCSDQPDSESYGTFSSYAMATETSSIGSEEEPRSTDYAQLTAVLSYSERSFPVLLKNISLSGCFVISGEKHKERRIVQLHIDFHGFSLQIPADIRRHEKCTPSGEGYGLGFRITSEQQQTAVRELISQLQKHGLTGSQQVLSHERRRAPRLHYRYPLHLSTDEINVQVPAAFLEVNAGGCSLITPAQITPGGQLIIHLVYSGTILKIPGIIVWKSGEKGMHKYGVHFNFSDPDQAKAIRRIVAEHRIAGKTRP